MITLLAEQPEPQSERRYSDRFATSLPSGLRRSGDPQKQVMLVSFSGNGCCVKTAANFRVGELVWVRLPGLEPLQARVRWSEYGTAGIIYDQPLHEAVVERILALDPAARKVTLQRETGYGAH